MMSFVNILLIAAVAFDTAEWLDKREMMTREAERLQDVYSWCAARLATPAENVRVPVDAYPDGSIKTLVLAEKAQMFLKEGYVWAQGVQIRENGTDKKLLAGIAAKKCAVDRSTKSGWIEGRARAVQKGVILDGVNAYVSAAEQYVAIFSNAQLVATMDAIRKDGDTNGTIRIRAARADFDREDGVICLDGQVRFDDKEYRLAADRAFAFIEGTNELRRVVAVGSVSVDNGPRVAQCKRAEYDCLTGQLMMYESRFEVETSGSGVDLKKVIGGEK